MFHVLEHLYDPHAYVEAAHGLLRPDGRLIVQVPNAASWQFLLLGENWSGVDVPRHLTLFRSRDLEVLLERCGFEVVRRKHFSLRDNPAVPGDQPGAVAGPDGAPCPRNGGRPAAAGCSRTSSTSAWWWRRLPWTLLEAACRAGSTVMVEARKRA